MSANSNNIDQVPVNAQTGAAQNDQTLPQQPSDVPLTGVQAGEGVSFADQVKGHAKMFAGKGFGNEKEVQQGAERIAKGDTAGSTGGSIP